MLLTLPIAHLDQNGTQMPGKITNADSGLAVKVTVDGTLIDFKGAPPQVQGSRILVPVRGVFEHLGAHLTWDPKTRTVTAVRGSTATLLIVGKAEATVGGKTVQVGTPPIVAQDRVMVPLRFLAEALGAEVEWLGADRTVAIKTKRAASPEGDAVPKAPIGL